MRQALKSVTRRMLPTALFLALAMPLAVQQDGSGADFVALEAFLDGPETGGEGSVPALDIDHFYAVVTNDVVGVRIHVADYKAAITGEASVIAAIDLNGDDESEFTFSRRPVEGSFGVYRGGRGSFDLACPLRVSPSGTGGIEMLAPASCLDSPSKARFGVYITTFDGYDYAGYWTPWLSPQADDPQVSPAPTYTAPPGPVTQYSVTSYPTSVRVNWAAPYPSGSAPINGYTAKLDNGRQCSTTGELSCTITGLSPSTYYRLSIVARNAVGDGAASTPRSIQTSPKYTAKVTVNASPEPVRKYSTLTVSGTLTIAGKAASGKAITLAFRSKGATKWSAVTTAKTTSTGTYKLKRTATRSGTWRVSYAGSSTATAASATDYVSVRTG